MKQIANQWNAQSTKIYVMEKGHHRGWEGSPNQAYLGSTVQFLEIMPIQQRYGLEQIQRNRWDVWLSERMSSWEQKCKTSNTSSIGKSNKETSRGCHVSCIRIVIKSIETETYWLSAQLLSSTKSLCLGMSFRIFSPLWNIRERSNGKNIYIPYACQCFLIFFPGLFPPQILLIQLRWAPILQSGEIVSTEFNNLQIVYPEIYFIQVCCFWSGGTLANSQSASISFLELS